MVDETLKSLEAPGNQERISRIVGSPEMQRAMRETARAVVEGAIESASVTPEQRAAIARDVDAVVASATRAALENASEQIPRTLAPAMTEGLASALDSPRLHEAIDRSTADATHAALVTSRDLIVGMREEGRGPDIFGRLRRLVVGACAAFFGLGIAAASLAAWALHLRSLARRTRIPSAKSIAGGP